MNIVTAVSITFVIRFLSIFPEAASIFLSNHVHPDSDIECRLSGDVFNTATACWVALYRLDNRGVTEVQICETRRIEAPLSGYIIDAKGFMELDGRVYTLFRVGIRDGEDDPLWAGEEFVFLAGGISQDGAVFYYPPGAGIEDPDGGYSLEREFLLGEELFLSIPWRYPESSELI